MNIEIKSRNIALTSRDRAMINRRVAFCFSRLNQMVKSITVTIEDINGPKGGVDIECRTVVRFSYGDRLVVSETRAHLADVVDSVLQRASYHAVQRSKRRQKRLHRPTRFWLDSEDNIAQFNQ